MKLSDDTMVPLSVFIITSCLLPFCGGNSTASEKFVKATNSFSIDFFKKLADGQHNVFISPFSVALSLTMVLLGARNNTAKEIKDALYSSTPNMTHQEILDACKASVFANKKNSKNVQFNVANSLWLQEGTTPLPDYKKLLAEVFNSEDQCVNFRSPDSKEIINKWVAEKTNNKIQHFFPKLLNNETKMALVNAIYFNGNWLKQFDTLDTEERPFRNFGSKVKLVPTMKERSDHPYTVSQHLSAEVLQLDYHGRDISMVIVLPMAETTLQIVESKLNLKVLNNLLRNLTESSLEVLVLLPKFTVETTLPLRKTLNSLCIKDAFSKTADLSGITGKRDLQISEAVQKSVIRVNEKGTQAASVTETIMTLLSLPDVVFKVDRPFMYIIKHNPTNTIIFMGKIVAL